ncbi:hypothetical protein, partial [Actinosynnema sp.]|uniref:hypothetical protein n=1 Tax=Actinosynnema sp. TaxID=1872144 RepID=UPI003F85DBDE
MSIRQRVLVGGAAVLLVGGAGVGGYVATAPRYAPTEVEVVDTADILYEPDLRAGVEDVRFHAP